MISKYQIYLPLFILLLFGFRVEAGDGMSIKSISFNGDVNGSFYGDQIDGDHSCLAKIQRADSQVDYYKNCELVDSLGEGQKAIGTITTYDESNDGEGVQKHVVGELITGCPPFLKNLKKEDIRIQQSLGMDPAAIRFCELLFRKTVITSFKNRCSDEDDFGSYGNQVMFASRDGSQAVLDHCIGGVLSRAPKDRNNILCFLKNIATGHQDVLKKTMGDIVQNDSTIFTVPSCWASKFYTPDNFWHSPLTGFFSVICPMALLPVPKSIKDVSCKIRGVAQDALTARQIAGVGSLSTVAGLYGAYKFARDLRGPVECVLNGVGSGSRFARYALGIRRGKGEPAPFKSHLMPPVICDAMKEMSKLPRPDREHSLFENAIESLLFLYGSSFLGALMSFGWGKFQNLFRRRAINRAPFGNMRSLSGSVDAIIRRSAITVQHAEVVRQQKETQGMVESGAAQVGELQGQLGSLQDQLAEVSKNAKKQNEETQGLVAKIAEDATADRESLKRNNELQLQQLQQDLRTASVEEAKKIEIRIGEIEKRIKKLAKDGKVRHQEVTGGLNEISKQTEVLGELKEMLERKKLEDKNSKVLQLRNVPQARVMNTFPAGFSAFGAPFGSLGVGNIVARSALDQGDSSQGQSGIFYHQIENDES